ncbi:uncharacterized protein METZ01_LOCUS235018 [marine metagenome]|uniref:Uncharacterized protein n=1 Tax=marine metagenome TaxID=408172 RepID=A0A382H4F2_9ZZZZ
MKEPPLFIAKILRSQNLFGVLITKQITHTEKLDRSFHRQAGKSTSVSVPGCI